MKRRLALLAAGLTGLLTLVPSSAALASPTSSIESSVPKSTSQLSTYQVIHSAAPRSGWFFSTQFTAGGHGSYIGLQPKGKGSSSGTLKVQAVFSSFGKGIKSSSKNCSSGADGGSGVSCSIRFDLKLKRKYELKVLGSNGIWKGYVIDRQTGQSRYIGSFQSSASPIKSTQTFWTERYLKGNDCNTSEIPKFDVSVYPPTANNGKDKGKLTKLTEGGPCKGKQYWNGRRDGSGYRISAGVKS